jgi:hypothetical protein
MRELNMTKQQWLELCYDNWTTSNVQTDAWKYRGDFAGFCKWFLADGNKVNVDEPKQPE